VLWTEAEEAASEEAEPAELLNLEDLRVSRPLGPPAAVADAPLLPAS